MKLLLSAPILLNFVFFVLLSMVGGGWNNFLVAGLGALHGTRPAVGNTALTGLLAMSAVGVLVGSALAGPTGYHKSWPVSAAGDRRHRRAHRPRRPGRAGLLVLVVSLSGFASGLAMPSRDMIVRAVTPPGSFGKVFGFVTTGFHIGGMVSPIIFGQLLDRGHRSAVFLYIAGCALLAVVTVGFGMAGRRDGLRLRVFLLLPARTKLLQVGGRRSQDVRVVVEEPKARCCTCGKEGGEPCWSRGNSRMRRAHDRPSCKSHRRRPAAAPACGNRPEKARISRGGLLPVFGVGAPSVALARVDLVMVSHAGREIPRKHPAFDIPGLRHIFSFSLHSRGWHGTRDCSRALSPDIRGLPHSASFSLHSGGLLMCPGGSPLLCSSASSMVEDVKRTTAQALRRLVANHELQAAQHLDGWRALRLSLSRGWTLPGSCRRQSLADAAGTKARSARH